MDLIVDGMTCGHCERAIRGAIETLDPHARVEIDRASRRVRIEGDLDPARAIAAIEHEGYAARLAVGAEPG